LHNTKFKSGSSMPDHLGTISRLVFEYNTIASNKITNEEHFLVILESLPADDPEWTVFRTMLENEAAAIADQEFDIVEVQATGAAGAAAAPAAVKKAVVKTRPGHLVQLVTSRLIVHAAKIAAKQQLRASATPQAFQVVRHGRGNRGNNGGGHGGGKQRKSNAACFNCGRRGHYKRDCWQAGGGKGGQGPNRYRGNTGAGGASGSDQAQGNAYRTNLVARDHVAFAVRTSNRFAVLADNDEGETYDTGTNREYHHDHHHRDAWVVDSGASNCFVRDRNAMFNFKPANGGTVAVGDDRKLAIRGTGDICLVPAYEPEARIIVTGCLYVPDL
ncbi:hypothetical protein HDU96_005387, partial [Phlyctochytrium bullatum]